MSENEAAELFNRELDVLLRDGRPPFPSHDEGLIRAAGVLAAADFSADSRVREELRARLTGENEGGGLLVLVAEAVNAAAFKVLFAAACLLLLVTQVVRQPARAPLPPAPTASLPASVKDAAPARRCLRRRASLSPVPPPRARPPADRFSLPSRWRRPGVSRWSRSLSPPPDPAPPSSRPRPAR
ncbi:MAG: hypothetical protein FD189_1833 [Elusimicrobia bacterium]|nr:MAG: hypothetical protein FD189_1833 [Elusimicrobiota bacterium]